jgi:hypothetical protein
MGWGGLLRQQILSQFLIPKLILKLILRFAAH